MEAKANQKNSMPEDSQELPGSPCHEVGPYIPHTRFEVCIAIDVFNSTTSNLFFCIDLDMAHVAGQFSEIEPA